MKKQQNYYVLSGDQWVKCKKARPVLAGWLEFELPRGCTGITPKQKWCLGTPPTKKEANE